MRMRAMLVAAVLMLGGCGGDQPRTVEDEILDYCAWVTACDPGLIDSERCPSMTPINSSIYDWGCVLAGYERIGCAAIRQCDADVRALRGECPARLSLIGECKFR